MEKTTAMYAETSVGWDRRDCTVRALAVAAGVEYEVASMTLSAGGRRVKKGMTVPELRRIYEGVLHMQPLDAVSAIQPRLVDFLAAHPQGRFVLVKRRHAFAVVDGVVHDWESTTNERTAIVTGWLVTGKTQARLAKMQQLVKEME